jgi:hypothetical protein
METSAKKSFDSVQLMRDIRDKISEETQNMTLEQLKKYIAERLTKSKLKDLGKC